MIVWFLSVHWIYNFLCNQCLSLLKLWVLIPLMEKCTWYNIMWWTLSVTCDRSVVFSINKTGRHDITEILLNVALNTITLTTLNYEIFSIFVAYKVGCMALKDSPAGNIILSFLNCLNSCGSEIRIIQKRALAG